MAEKFLPKQLLQSYFCSAQEISSFKSVRIVRWERPCRSRQARQDAKLWALPTGKRSVQPSSASFQRHSRVRW